MKPNRFIAIILCLVLSGHMLARAQDDMDTAITKLTEDLAGKITSKESRKVTVLDFTDLENNPTELGKYIADQVTVDFVMNNRSFSVLDRAHLKKIMDEHKFTASGLVDPETAKQLGKFAGVDAMIFGKTILVGENVSVTVQIISTETGMVITGGKAKFKNDAAVQQLLAKPAPSENQPQPENKPPSAPALASQKDGNLVVVLNQMRTLNDGSLQVDLTFQNKSTNNSIAVAMYHDVCFVPPCSMPTVLIAGDGHQFGSYDDGLTGIRSLAKSPLALTEILPNAELKASIEFRGGHEVSPTVKTFSLRSTIVVNQNYSASSYDNYAIRDNVLPPYCKLVTVFLDFPVSMH